MRRYQDLRFEQEMQDILLQRLHQRPMLSRADTSSV